MQLQAIKQVKPGETMASHPVENGYAKATLDKAVYIEGANHLLEGTPTCCPTNADFAKEINQQAESKIKKKLRNDAAISKNGVQLGAVSRCNTHKNFSKPAHLYGR